MILAAFFAAGCAAPKVTLFPDASEPLQEAVLEGSGKDKILVIPIAGIITERPKIRILRSAPSVVQEVVSHLRLAEKDDAIKTVLFKIDSPGGTTTASDILYHEIMAFKQRTGKKAVVCMMNLAASGGYYVALPADVIVAHPTTVTGSIGVILMRPEVTGLMEKIGIGVQVNKSGENKDMGSPFRPVTPDEDNLLQDLADALGRRFVDLVKQHRDLQADALARVADARIFLAAEALAAGLVDRIGYLPDAIEAAKTVAGLDDNARVITYRRTFYADDNVYNTLASGSPERSTALLLDTGLAGDLLALDAGFYYLWPQALGAP
jgi:protease-4